MTKLKLTYFDAPTSRGEECRLALFVAGIDFEDHRLARAEWTALKPTTPFGSLPVLELAGKPPVSQSNAILAYVGRQHGLLPTDAWEALRLESLLSACETCVTPSAKRSASKIRKSSSSAAPSSSKVRSRPGHATWKSRSRVRSLGVRP